MNTVLPIVWQRLVNSNGKTCGRCGDTQREVEQAVETLRAVLRPLNIIPLLDVLEIDEATFEADPLESNRIWVAGRPLEDWVGGDVGGSRCDSVCGGSDCRTVQVEGVRLETIPGRLIVKAALLAASERI